MRHVRAGSGLRPAGGRAIPPHSSAEVKLDIKKILERSKRHGPFTGRAHCTECLTGMADRPSAARTPALGAKAPRTRPAAVLALNSAKRPLRLSLACSPSPGKTAVCALLPLPARRRMRRTQLSDSLPRGQAFSAKRSANCSSPQPRARIDAAAQVTGTANPCLQWRFHAIGVVSLAKIAGEQEEYAHEESSCAWVRRNSVEFIFASRFRR